MAEYLLEVESVSAAYGNIRALQDVSLKVPQGAIVALLGANGAGKSTTLNVISRLVSPTAGSVRFDGEAIHRQPADAIVGRGIVQVPEGREIFRDMSVRENLEMGAYLRHDRQAVKQDLDMVCDTFPRLRERFEQKAATLSGGEQQMLVVGRALMTNPKLLILDEATEGLAPLIRQEIWRCLRTLKAEGQTILVIDKNLPEMATLVDRHYIVDKGRVAWSGQPAELSAQPELAQRYLGI